jgi:hypothetical protein
MAKYERAYVELKLELWANQIISHSKRRKHGPSPSRRTAIRLATPAYETKRWACETKPYTVTGTEFATNSFFFSLAEGSDVVIQRARDKRAVRAPSGFGGDPSVPLSMYASG